METPNVLRDLILVSHHILACTPFMRFCPSPAATNSKVARTADISIIRIRAQDLPCSYSISNSREEGGRASAKSFEKYTRVK